MLEGIYESLLTESLSKRISGQDGLNAQLSAIDPADQPRVLSRHVAEELLRVLESTKDPVKRVETVQTLLDSLTEDADTVDPRMTMLEALVAEEAPGDVPISTKRPRTPLSDAALLTNAHGEPSLGAELKAELETADRVDLLCAFV